MNTSHDRTTTHSVAILAGGRSRRMGFDKARARFGAQSLLERTVHVAAASSPAAIFVCGGPSDPIADLAVEYIADTQVDGGPLVGLLGAVEAAPSDRLALVAVDLPFVTASTIRDILSELDTADVAVPVVAGRRQWHVSAWKLERCRDQLNAAFVDGARSFDEATWSLDVREVEPGRPEELADVDTPADLLDSGGRPPPPQGLS